MGSEGIDYATIIADLEHKKSLLDAAIASLRAALAGGAFGLSDGTVPLGSPAMPTSIQGGEVPDGAFLGKSIPAAMKLYLSIVAKKQTTREIADAIQKGGLETTSKKNFDKIVYATLDRLRRNGEFVKIGDAWGLPEWYPAHIRAGLSQPGKPRSKPTKWPSRKARVKAAKKTPAKAAESIQAKLLTDGGPQAAIKGFFTSHPGREFSSKDVAQSLGLKVQTVGLVVGKLVHSGVLEKTENGMFRAR